MIDLGNIAQVHADSCSFVTRLISLDKQYHSIKQTWTFVKAHLLLTISPMLSSVYGIFHCLSQFCLRLRAWACRYQRCQPFVITRGQNAEGKSTLVVDVVKG